MKLSFFVKAAIAAAIFGIPLAAQAQAVATQTPPTNASAASCHQALDKAEPAIAKMAAGVEKMAAQKEVASAKLDLAKGDVVSCNGHAKNALQAIQAKGTQ